MLDTRESNVKWAIKSGFSLVNLSCSGCQSWDGEDCTYRQMDGWVTSWMDTDVHAKRLLAMVFRNKSKLENTNLFCDVFEKIDGRYAQYIAHDWHSDLVITSNDLRTYTAFKIPIPTFIVTHAYPLMYSLHYLSRMISEMYLYRIEILVLVLNSIVFLVVLKFSGVVETTKSETETETET